MVRFKQIPRPTIVRKHNSLIKPIQTLKLPNRLLPKKCSNGHSNHCSAKKCSTCGRSVLSMSANAVAKRKYRAAKKAVSRPFTDVQLQRLGFVVGAQTLFESSTVDMILCTVTHITETGINFHNGAVQY